MLFNPVITTQTHGVIFSRKITKTDYPIISFNEEPVANTPSQKHLGMDLMKSVFSICTLKKILQKQTRA